MSNKSKRSRRHLAKAYRSLKLKSTSQRETQDASFNAAPQPWSSMEALEPRVLFSASFLDGLPVIDYSLVVEEGPQAAIVAGEDANASPASALSDTFSLHSNPGASHTIYLDFDGHVTVNTSWNSWSGVDTIVTPAYDFDGDTSFFSDAELTRIGYIFQRVAEDFAPFDVDVTTENPLLDDLIKSGSGDTRWGARMVIGGSSTDWTGTTSGGYAWVGSFNWSSDTPSFVFENQLGNGNEKYTAEAISHEIGHMLGLSHDGNSSTGYYTGHGSGETGWAPLMGVGYYQNLTQWSSGEYAGANNTQDDLSIITSQNGFGYRADDHGSTIGTASNLTLSGSSLSGSGIIEQNTDSDVFAFSTDAGTINLDISPFQRGPNLDILAELYDVSDNLIIWSNPVDSLGASLSADVSAGTYFLKITGVGKGDPSGTAYSDYGSLGQYTISGQVVEPPTSFSVSDVTVNENDGTATFTVSLSQALSQAVTVDVATADGTALQFSDYQAVSQTLTFDAGQTIKSVVVSLVDDSVTESDETFTLQLSNATGGVSIFDGQGIGTIVDNDTPVFVNISDVTVNEADGIAIFIVSLSDASSNTVTVNVATVDGTALQSVDYLAVNQTLTFEAGETSKSVVVSILDDGDTEADETFTLQLSTATNAASIGDGEGVATIVDNDTVIYVNIGDVTLNEGNPKKGKNAGPRTTQATFTITLSEASNEVVTVQYTTLDGTATSGSDYSFQSGSVTFAAGQTTQTVTIDVVGDGDVEPDETFKIDLTGSTNATIADGQAIGTILNDDSSGGGGGKGGGKKTLTDDASQSDDLSDTRSSLLARFNQQHRDSAPGLARANPTSAVASSSWRLVSVLDSSDGDTVHPWQRVSGGFQLESYAG